MLLTVQTAMYSLLTANTPLMATITGVFDEVPAGQLFPYVTIGLGVEVAHNTLEHMGRDLICRLSVWSVGTGFAEGLTIADLVVKALDNQPLAVGTGSSWRCQFDDIHTLRDADGFTRHVAISFRVGTQL
jgi:hypothetical protein